jgi:lipopolysaccharide export system permease protein
VTILEKMIFKDLLKTSLSILVVIVVIIVSRKFIKILAKAIDGQLSVDAVMSMLGYKIIVVTTMFIPAAVFMAVLMVLGRMYRDQEMAAVASAGGGVGIIYRAVFWFVIPAVLLSSALSLFVAPWAEAQTQIIVNKDQNMLNVKGIEAGRFSEYRQGKVIFYAEDVDSDEVMHSVFMQTRDAGRKAVVASESGVLRYQPDGLFLVLREGERVQGKAGQRDFILEHFARYGILIEQGSKAVSLHLEALPVEALLESDEVKKRTQWQQRLSIPMGLMLLAFLAVPLTKLSPRGGVYGSLFVAFVIYFIYANLKRVAQSWAVSGVLLPWQSFFLVYGVMFLVGIVLLVRLYGWQWIKEQIVK